MRLRKSLQLGGLFLPKKNNRRKFATLKAFEAFRDSANVKALIDSVNLIN